MHSKGQSSREKNICFQGWQGMVFKELCARPPCNWISDTRHKYVRRMQLTPPRLELLV